MATVPENAASLSGTEKAAILLLYIGTEATSKILQHMDDNEIKKISQAMANLGHVGLPVIQEVVEEYQRITDPESGFFAQGEEYVRKILEKALGPQKAELLLMEMQSTTFGDIEDILSNMDAKTIANFLSQEHPQTIAVIVAKLRPKQTSEIISQLPQDLQAEVVIRIAEVDQVSPDILAEIDEVIRIELTALGGVQRFKVGGVEKVVDMFAQQVST